VLEAWNAALNSHDVDALGPLYAARVDFYGTSLTRAQVVARKRKALAASPKFEQHLSEITIEASPDGSMVARFVKTSGPAARTADVRATLS